MTRVTLDATGAEMSSRTTAPRRVLLPAGALDRLAELGGVPSPAARMRAANATVENLRDRLGERVQPARPADSAMDPAWEETLRAAGLISGAAGAAQVTSMGRAVLDVWHRPDLVIELELLLSTRRGRTRVRSWHRNLGEWVVCLSTTDGRRFELARLSAEDWWLELERAVCVDHEELLPVAESEVVLPAVLETPWELLVATGEAVIAHRADLLDQLVGDHAGATLAGETPAALTSAGHGEVRAWHELLETASRGRLHGAVLGRSERGRPSAGIVEWVLLPDGWRSLTALRRDGQHIVRIERRGPGDLGRDLGMLAAEVAT